MSGPCCGPTRGPGVGSPPAPPAGAPGPTPRARSGTAGPSADPPVGPGHVSLTGGTFSMGNEDETASPEDGEGPVREVRVGPFSVDVHTVTNADFAAFVVDTGYRTDAERAGWSFVFAGHLNPGARDHVRAAHAPGTPWWLPVAGATWTSPHGPGSTVVDALDHPVVQVSWADATAWAEWAGRRLPTEAEWEYAARGGLERARYPWGDELHGEDGGHRCNIWHGSFPSHNTAADGFDSTAPVRWFDPNGFGLFQCVGNVWEWCADWFVPGDLRAMRGGSHLCHDSYCNRYRVAARTGTAPDTATSHIGFRTAGEPDRCGDG